MVAKKYFFQASFTVIFGILPFFLSGCMGERTEVEVREDMTERILPHSENAANTYCVYLITMDQVSNYWQHIDAGCRKAVRELGNVDYHWVAPLKNNIGEQRQLIEQAIADGAEAILLSAASPSVHASPPTDVSGPYCLARQSSTWHRRD